MKQIPIDECVGKTIRAVHNLSSHCLITFTDHTMTKLVSGEDYDGSPEMQYGDPFNFPHDLPFDRHKWSEHLDQDEIDLFELERELQEIRQREQIDAREFEEYKRLKKRFENVGELPTS